MTCGSSSFEVGSLKLAVGSWQLVRGKAARRGAKAQSFLGWVFAPLRAALLEVCWRGALRGGCHAEARRRRVFQGGSLRLGAFARGLAGGLLARGRCAVGVTPRRKVVGTGHGEATVGVRQECESIVAG